MALINCIDCLGKVSIDAKACPHCGMAAPGFAGGVAAKVSKGVMYIAHIALLFLSIGMILFSFGTAHEGFVPVYLFLSLWGIIKTFTFMKYES